MRVQPAVLDFITSAPRRFWHHSWRAPAGGFSWNRGPPSTTEGGYDFISAENMYPYYEAIIHKCHVNLMRLSKCGDLDPVTIWLGHGPVAVPFARTVCRNFPRNGMGLVFISIVVGFFFCPACLEKQYGKATVRLISLVLGSPKDCDHHQQPPQADGLWAVTQPGSGSLEVTQRAKAPDADHIDENFGAVGIQIQSRQRFT